MSWIRPTKNCKMRLSRNKNYKMSSKNQKKQSMNIKKSYNIVDRILANIKKTSQKQKKKQVKL